MSSKVDSLHAGLTGRAEMVVAERHTAVSMGSGRMPVLASPAMIALMEAAAQDAVDRCLPADEMSVGIHLDVHHSGATPVGMRVIATAELTAVAGRTLDFRLTAHDEKDLIGEGTHRRTIAREASFQRLLQQKLRLI